MAEEQPNAEVKLYVKTAIEEKEDKYYKDFARKYWILVVIGFISLFVYITYRTLNAAADSKDTHTVELNNHIKEFGKHTTRIVRLEDKFTTIDERLDKISGDVEKFSEKFTKFLILQAAQK